MTGGLKPIRRVVTGNDARGRSRVVWDGPAPNTHETSLGSGRGHTDLWVWNEAPAPLSGTNDDGNLPYTFCGPSNGGPANRSRVTSSTGASQSDAGVEEGAAG